MLKESLLLRYRDVIGLYVKRDHGQVLRLLMSCVLNVVCTQMGRGVLIISSANISATDMAFCTNIGIGTKQ